MCTDLPDQDQTPSSVTFVVDTTVPNTFATRTPREELRPDWPVVLTRRPQLVLNSNDGLAGYACTVNKKAVPCAQGLNTLPRLKSGDQDFAARAVDAAGNTDPSPATARFFVPANLRATKGAGWKKVRDRGSFDGDLVKATRPGATLRIGRQRNVREVRLIAPSGPKQGRIQVRVGRSQWYTVDLKGAKKKQPLQTFLVRNQYTPLQSGSILIRVLSVPKGGSVLLDALVARK